MVADNAITDSIHIDDGEEPRVAVYRSHGLTSEGVNTEGLAATIDFCDDRVAEITVKPPTARIECHTLTDNDGQSVGAKGLIDSVFVEHQGGDRP